MDFDIKDTNTTATASHDCSSMQAVSMFSTATRLFGTATSMAQAARAAAESTWASHEEAQGARLKEGVAPISFADGDAAGAASAASQKRMEEELEVLKARLTVAQDQLKAERAAHSQSAAKALSGEVAALSEALIRERQEFEREKVQLGKHLRGAKEDVPQAPDEGNGDLTEQMMELRRQRDQARGVAQRIARQVSVLAEQLEILQSSREAFTSALPDVSAPEPEQTLLQMDAAEGRRPVSASNGPVPAGAGASHRDPTEEGDEGSAPRPPVEITSGWDVFNPDDQLEHTIPTGRTEPTANTQDGWGDFDFDDLM